MLEKIKTWHADPFNSDMSATDWFLFIGLLIICAVLWRVLLNHILEGIS